MFKRNDLLRSEQETAHIKLVKCSVVYQMQFLCEMKLLIILHSEM
jgi:hypothetical protein